MVEIEICFADLSLALVMNLGEVEAMDPGVNYSRKNNVSFLKGLAKLRTSSTART